MTTTSKKLDYYGPEMTERRDKFNRIINGMNMVLMNKIPEVDESIWENWQGDSNPMNVCEVEDGRCTYHDEPLDDDNTCAYNDEMVEVYQWFAVGDNDADYLKSHGQYITYSDMLDTYFLAICHFGTSWDYVDGMVNDILGDR